MKVLIGGFRGGANSARIVVDKIACTYMVDKLYLVNSFEVSKYQLEGLLQKQEYDLIILFGQKPKVKSLFLESQACINGNILIANYQYNNLYKMLTDNGFTTVISSNAGNYLCNNIFYVGLKFIKDHSINTKLIFIHTPSMNNIKNIDGLAHVLSTYIDQFCE